MARTRNQRNGRLEESLRALQHAEAQMLQALASLAQHQTAMMARMAQTDAEIAQFRREAEETRRDIAETNRLNTARFERIEALLAGLPEAVHRRFGFQPPQGARRTNNMKADLDAKKVQTPEDRLKQRLLELGLLTNITPPLPADAYPRNRRPIPLEGRPGSRIILEERR